METLSLKALSHKVLKGNSQGNFWETGLKNKGNFDAKKEGKVSHEKEHEAKLRLVSKDALSFPEVSKMTLEDFAKTDMVLKVSSSLLGEVVYFVSNEMTLRKRGELGGPAYTARELQALLDAGAKGEDLKRLHEAKKEFGGKFFND